MKNNILKFIFVTAIICLLQIKPALAQNEQSSSRNQLSEKIDTTNLNLASFAQGIIGNTASNFDKAKKLLDWLSNRLLWIPTDYKKRTAREILARGGGNCFELAVVYMALIKELKIQYRPVAEININQYNEERQQTAAEKVKQSGNRMSVFGRQHNDHRWVEIYDDRNKEWVPADPSMNVIGTEQWLKARVWFGKRETIDTAFTNEMIVPIAVFVVSDTNKTVMIDSRTKHYVVGSFDKLYDHKLSKLPSWRNWVKQVDELDEYCKAAFEGRKNLHEQTEKISSLAKVYQQLKKEYLDKYH